MNFAPEFLTEKQEQALRRMEQLAELRRVRRGGWRLFEYDVFISRLFPLPLAIFWLGFALYQFCSKPVTRGSNILVIFAVVYAVLSFVFFFFITPMKRRLERLERLLEEELKRKPLN